MVNAVCAVSLPRRKAAGRGDKPQSYPSVRQADLRGSLRRGKPGPAAKPVVVEQTFVHLAHAAAWVFLITMVFAIIGVFATIRWVIGLVTGAERAVEGEVSRVGHHIKGDFKE
jgi:hypothetical protein